MIFLKDITLKDLLEMVCVVVLQQTLEVLELRLAGTLDQSRMEKVVNKIHMGRFPMDVK